MPCTLLALLLTVALQASPDAVRAPRWALTDLPPLPAAATARPGLAAALGGSPVWIDPGTVAGDAAAGSQPATVWCLDTRTGTWLASAELPALGPAALVVSAGDELLVRAAGLPDARAPGLWRLVLRAVGDVVATPWGASGPGTLPRLEQPVAAWCAGRLVVLGRAADPAIGGLVYALDGEGSRSALPLPACPTGPRAGAAVAPRSLAGASELVVCGGTLADGAVTDEVWAFDPLALTWTALAPLPAPRTDASAWPLGPAHVVLLGGRGSGGADGPAPALAWHAVTGAWTTWDDVPQLPRGTQAVPLAEGLALFATPAPAGASGGDSTAASLEWTAPHLLRQLPSQHALADLDLLVLVAYLALLLGVGAWFVRRVHSRGDYFLAGRRIPWWAAGLSLYGTQLSAITFMTTPALAFATDLRYAPTWLAVLAIAPVVGRLYIPVLRRLDVRTAYEYLELRFSPLVRRVGSGVFVVYQLARMAIVVYLPSLAVAALTGLDTGTCIVLTGALATAYTVLGGLEAVVWTDVVQVVVLMGGVLVALLLGLSDLGGVSGLVELAGPAGKLRLWDNGFALTSEASWSLLIGAFFLQFGPYVTDQAFVQRYLATPDEASARRGLLLNGWLSLPAALLFPTLGVVLWAWFAEHPDAMQPGMRHDAVVPVFLAARLPAGLAGLVVAGLFAATMSSLDSAMHSVATTVSHDWRRAGRAEPTGAGGARWLTVTAGLAGTGAALALGTLEIPLLFLFFQKVVGLLASGTAAMFLLGLLTRRVGPGGALLAAAASTAAVAWAAFASHLHPFWYGALGIGCGCALGWAHSRIGRGSASRMG